MNGPAVVPAPATAVAPATAAGAEPARPVLPTIEDPDFHASVKPSSAGRFRVALAGTADLNVKKQLDAFLSTVHALAVEQELTEVEVDLTALEFMNSSCLKGMVSWIAAVQGTPADRQYRIKFLAKVGSRWQRRSLYALSCVAAHLVSIQD